MRSSLAQSRRFLAAWCVLALGPGLACADTIYLKNGRTINGSNVVQEGGRVEYDTPTGHLSLPASIVDRLVRGPAQLDSPAGTPRDRAANLPIAPPDALAPPADDETTRVAVHDGAIDSEALYKLESEARSNSSPTAIARAVAAE